MSEQSTVVAMPLAERPALPSTTDMENAAMISVIERAARDPSVDIAKLERLVELQAQAQARRAKSAYLTAIAKMQSELPAVARHGKGHNDKRYARFEDIVNAVMPVLTKHGFSLTYRVTQTETTMTVIGVLGHAEGHTEQTEMTLPADNSGGKNIVQAWGSSASYGKRYVALTLLGIATEDEDDDGRAAARVKRKSSAESKRDGTSQRFNEIKVAFELAPDLPTLRQLSREVADEINSMPEAWATILSNTWDDRAETLKAAQA